MSFPAVGSSSMTPEQVSCLVYTFTSAFDNSNYTSETSYRPTLIFLKILVFFLQISQVSGTLKSSTLLISRDNLFPGRLK